MQQEIGKSQVKRALRSLFLALAVGGVQNVTAGVQEDVSEITQARARVDAAKQAYDGTICKDDTKTHCQEALDQFLRSFAMLADKLDSFSHKVKRLLKAGGLLVSQNTSGDRAEFKKLRLALSPDITIAAEENLMPPSFMKKLKQTYLKYGRAKKAMDKTLELAYGKIFMQAK